MKYHEAIVQSFEERENEVKKLAPEITASCEEVDKTSEKFLRMKHKSQVLKLASLLHKELQGEAVPELKELKFSFTGSDQLVDALLKASESKLKKPDEIVAIFKESKELAQFAVLAPEDDLFTYLRAIAIRGIKNKLFGLCTSNYRFVCIDSSSKTEVALH